MSISPKDGLLFFGSLAVGVITGSLGGWVVTAWYEYTKQKNKEERKERNARELRNKAIIPTLALVALIAFFLYFFSFSAFLLQFTDQNSTIEKSTSQSNAIINKTVHIENTYYTNNFTNITSIENKFSQPNCDNGTMQINSNKIASSNTDPLKEIPGAWLREIAGLAIFILFCYILYKIHKSEKIEKMIFGIMAIIFAALFFVVIYWDPAWAAPFLTIGLLLMTVFSTVSNQRLVDLNEKERHSRVYANMAITIFSPIKEMIKDTEIWLQSGHILQRSSNIEKLPANQKISLFILPSSLLKTRIHYPDNVLNKYLPQIEQLSKEFEKSSDCIEKNLTNIIQKRNNIWQEFKVFCHSLDNSRNCIMNEEGYEMVFAFTIADSKIDYQYQNFLFYQMNRDQLRSKLIELSFEENMVEYQKNRGVLIKTMKEMDDLISELISDWQREYNLIESDIARSSL